MHHTVHISAHHTRKDHDVCVDVCVLLTCVCIIIISLLEFALSALVKPLVVNVGRAGAANLDVIQEVEYVKMEVCDMGCVMCHVICYGMPCLSRECHVRFHVSCFTSYP